MALSIPPCERVAGTAPAPGRVLGEVARNRRGRVRSDGVRVPAARSGRARVTGYLPVVRDEAVRNAPIEAALRAELIGHLFGK